MKQISDKSEIEKILRYENVYENYRALLAEAMSGSIDERDLKRLNSYFKDINRKAEFSQWDSRNVHNYQYTENKIREMYPQTLCKCGASTFQKA